MLRIHPAIRLLAIIGSISASAAAAADFSYPATMCVVEDGTMARSYNTAYNPSSAATAKFLCPGVKTPSSTSADGWIRVKDQSNTENLSCTLTFGRQSGADLFGVTDKQTTSGYDSDWQTLYFDALSLTASYSSTYISCTLPKKTTFGESAVGTYTLFDS